MNPTGVDKPAEPRADSVEHSPATPDERAAWIGLGATLVLCLVVAVIYFWASGTHGR